MKTNVQKLLLLTALIFSQSALAQRQIRRPILIKKLKSALLVMIENGGVVPNELRERKISVPTGYFKCGKHRIRVTTANGLLSAAADYFTTVTTDLTDRCLNPFTIAQRWRAETREYGIGEAINHFSDRVIEGATKDSISNHANAKYDKVFIIESSQFNPTRALSILKTHAKTHFFDIHVLAHGSDELFVGGNTSQNQSEYFTANSFFNPLEELQNNGLRLIIRSVYQQNCVGYSLSDDWIRVGAKVVSGTPDNNYMPLAYGDFLFKWLYMRKNFKDAVEEGFQAQEGFYRSIYRFVFNFPESEVNSLINGSYPLFLGNERINFNTNYTRLPIFN